MGLPRGITGLPDALSMDMCVLAVGRKGSIGLFWSEIEGEGGTNKVALYLEVDGTVSVRLLSSYISGLNLRIFRIFL